LHALATALYVPLTLSRSILWTRWNAIMSNGNTCTADELALFNSSHGASIVCLTRGDSIGLTLVAESGFISLVAVLVAFTLIFVCTLRMIYTTFQTKLVMANSTMHFGADG